MKTTHIDILTALQSYDEAINIENKETNLDSSNSLIDDLATHFAKAVVQAQKGEKLALDSDSEKEIIQQKQLWSRYLQETKDLLNQGIAIFESYDNKNLLKAFFQKIRTGKRINPYTLPKYIDIMLKYATQAFESETWKDAYLMLNFIAAYEPTYPKTYLPLGLCIEELKGLDQASEYYKVTCEVLKDPDLYFFAANCELKLEHKDKAKEYLFKLKEVLGNTTSLTEDQQELLTETDEILQALEQAA